MLPLDHYSCEEVFRRLDDYLDRELEPGATARVREHLETCGACAAEFAFETSVLTDLRTKLRRVRVPATLHERLRLRLAGTMLRAHTLCRGPAPTPR